MGNKQLHIVFILFQSLDPGFELADQLPRGNANQPGDRSEQKVTFNRFIHSIDRPDFVVGCQEQGPSNKMNDPTIWMVFWDFQSKLLLQERIDEFGFPELLVSQFGKFVAGGSE